MISFFFVNYVYSQNINLEELLFLRTKSYIEIDSFLTNRQFVVSYDYYPENYCQLFAVREKISGESETLCFISPKPYIYQKGDYYYRTSNKNHYLSILKQIKNNGYLENKSKNEVVEIGLKLFKKNKIIIECHYTFYGKSREYTFTFWDEYIYDCLH